MRAKKEIQDNFCFCISFSCLCNPIPTSPLKISLTIRIYFPMENRTAQELTQEIGYSSFAHRWTTETQNGLKQKVPREVPHQPGIPGPAASLQSANAKQQLAKFSSQAQSQEAL